MKSMRAYGLLAGLTFVAWQYLLYFIAPEAGSNIYLALVPLLAWIVFIYLAIMHCRKAGNSTDFNQAFKTGLGVSALGALIASVGTYIYYKWIDSTWIPRLVPQWKEMLLKQGTAADEIGSQLERVISSYPLQASIAMLAKLIAIGLLISLIMALLLRKSEVEEA